MNNLVIKHQMFPFKVELFTLMLSYGMLFKPITSLSSHEANNWLSYTPSLQTIFKSFPIYIELHD